MDTLLDITGMRFSPYAARGLTQTLSPIEQAKQLRRTASGKLVDVSVEQFRKYRSTTSCTDHRVSAIDGIWPGIVVTVSYIADFSYPTGETPSQPMVTGSIRGDGCARRRGRVRFNPRSAPIAVSYFAFGGGDCEGM